MLEKRIIVLAVVILFVVSLSAEITTNELSGGMGFSVDKAEEKEIVFPYLSYSLESEKGDFLFGLDSEINHILNNEMESDIIFAIAPKGEYAISERFGTTISFPIEYSNKEITVNGEFEVTFGNLEEDIERLSPWASFEKGYNFGVLFDKKLENSGESNLNFNLGYAFLFENNMMLKPNVIFYQLISESDSEIEPTYSIQIAKDIAEYFTINFISEADKDFELTNCVEFYLYTIKKLELSTWFSLQEDDYSFGVNIDYKIFE